MKKKKPPNARFCAARIGSIILMLVLFYPVAAQAVNKNDWTPITDAERKQVYEIGRREGVPLSVVRQLMWEESRGYVDAFSDLTKEVYRSRGLFQIYERPDNLGQLLNDHWALTREEFNINDPIDNATVALAYLAALHARFGNWYQALIYYNHGSIKGYSEETRAYAKRIINAP